MRRASTSASALLLSLVAIVVAESSLAALIVLFGTILQLNLSLQLGDHYLQFVLPPWQYRPAVTVYNAGSIASVFFTATCGALAATWKFRRWRAPR